jgi:uncharacterized membrane protein
MNWLVYALGDWFWFLLIAQIVIIIITIVIATSKGYSGFLAFLLGLFIPLLGSLIIVALLPDQNIRYSHSHNGNSSHNTYNRNSPEIDLSNISPVYEKKMCKNCLTLILMDENKCPKCGGADFDY